MAYLKDGNYIDAVRMAYNANTHRVAHRVIKNKLI
jgi:hypothetical protein